MQTIRKRVMIPTANSRIQWEIIKYFKILTFDFTIKIQWLSMPIYQLKEHPPPQIRNYTNN